MADEALNDVARVWRIVEQYLVAYSFQLLGALAILFVGVWIANRVGEAARRLGERRKIDVTLTRFAANFVKILIVALVAVAALNNLGITIAPLIAAIGAAAFGATVALQGVLSNYGAGLSIIVTRPFQVGHTIAVKNVSGQVIDISLGATKLRGDGGETITVPNKQIVGEILSNSFGLRHTDLSVKLGPGADVDGAMARVRAALGGAAGVAADPPALVGIGTLDETGATLFVRYWAPATELLPTRFAANRAVLDALKA